jgi:hypothetical protein
MKIHGLSPSDMGVVDKVFTDYITKTLGDENEARMKTVKYLTTALGWEHSFAMKAAAIAIQDGGPKPKPDDDGSKPQ